MAISTANVWAEQFSIGNNTIRQLLVPACKDMGVSEDASGLSVHDCYGRWPAIRGAVGNAAEHLVAVLPTVDRSTFRVSWSGTHLQLHPDVVLETYREAIGFTPHDEPGSLRRPQIAALHSIVGYQSSGLDEPAIVVMPTGTGKTETMLAWMVATRPPKLLVIVPSTALRNQIAAKFETLGILQREGIVSPTAQRPCVGRLEHGFTDLGEAATFVDRCNVVVATPNALHAGDPEARAVLLAGFTHLVVDEAHHAPATTWTAIIRQFDTRPVLLFTATPFRTDGRPLPGRVISRFPLREAQNDGYFSRIEFASIVAILDPDRDLAAAAIARLTRDREAGFEHILLARAATKARAEEIFTMYQSMAPEAEPHLLHDGLSSRRKAEALAALADRRCHLIVCVDMLGEGFDLPNLKIAAFHDNRKSLGPVIQLVGRLARTQSTTPIGSASVFVSRDPATQFSPLRKLLREDPDWDKVLSDITDRAIATAEEVSEFDQSFTTTPSEVPVGLVEPKMSAVAYRSYATEWNPDAALDVYGETVLEGVISVSSVDNVAWFVIEAVGELRWGEVPGLQTVSYDLVAMYFDNSLGLLFIHGSDTDRKYDQLAKAVLGEEPTMIRGMDTFRIFAQLDRLIPTNVGLLDSRDRDKRFSMHVGSDVETALNEAERNHKTNTHIAAKAFENGERVTIAAALSGRFWSMRTAAGLSQWRDWCRHQGTKLLDTSVDLRSLFREMIIPMAVTERPHHPLLALEWPWNLYLGTGTAQHAVYDGKRFLLTDVDFRVDDYSTVGPFQFSVVTTLWDVPYTAVVGDTGLHYRAVGAEIEVESRGSTVPLSTWFNNHKPTLFLSGDRLITGDDRLLEPRTELPPYDRASLSPLPWIARGVDITVESQGIYRRQDSVQAYMSRYLQNHQAFDVLIDDDRAGEAADLVGLRVDGSDLIVTLVHCKYSSQSTPGGRLADLYEVCGQATRGARWRDHGAIPLLNHIDRRARNYALRTGQTAYEVGDREALLRIQERAPLLFIRFATIIAQPGLSIAASTDEQMRLLAGAESYVRAVTKGTFNVYCST